MSLKFDRPDIETFIRTIVERENASKAAAEKREKSFILPRERDQPMIRSVRSCSAVVKKKNC